MTAHRDEALKALKTLIERLSSLEPIDGMNRYQLKAVAEYAQEQVALIQEVRRVRKVKEVAG